MRNPTKGVAMAYLPDSVPTFGRYKIPGIILLIAIGATLLFNLWTWF